MISPFAAMWLQMETIGATRWSDWRKIVCVVRWVMADVISGVDFIAMVLGPLAI